jgi:hypothetical protein
VSLLAAAAADRLLTAREYAAAAPALIEALREARRDARWPHRRVVLNIEPPPSASAYAPRYTAAAVVRAAAHALALVETWRLFDRLGADSPATR